MLLCDEISMGIEGEIDEQAPQGKRSLVESRSHANNVKGLTRVMAVHPSLGPWPSTCIASGTRSPFAQGRSICRCCRCRCCGDGSSY